MKENYPYIKPDDARSFFEEARKKESDKYGVNSRVFLFEDLVILQMKNFDVRNVSVEDKELIYFNQLIDSLMVLRNQGVNVIPTLGYCFDPDNEDSEGFIFQERAKGEELYDDSLLIEFYVLAQDDSDYSTYLKSLPAKEHLLSRTEIISNAPQVHFDKFISDIITLIDNNLLIDFFGKSNFFYDKTSGFQFIDINAHSDYYYGLTEDALNSLEIASIFGFTPCHLSEETEFLNHIALADKAMNSTLSSIEIDELKKFNKDIFLKCERALLNNGVSKEQIERSISTLKFYGM